MNKPSELRSMVPTELVADLKWFAFVAIAVVAICRALDFLIGARGRTRIHELLIVTPWFGLSLLDLSGLISTAAAWFVRMLRAVFGGDYGGRSFVVHYFMVTVGGFLAMPFIRHIPEWGIWTIGTVAPTSAYIPPDSGGVMFAAYPFTFLSYMLTRYLAERIAKRRALLPAITFWIVDLLASTLIVALLVLTVGVLLGHLPYLSHWEVQGWPLRVSPLTPFFALLVAAPSAFHLLFFLGILPLATLETIRRVSVFVLERVDESGKRPLLVLSGVAASIGALTVALIRLLSV